MGRKASGVGLKQVQDFWQAKPGEKTVKAGAEMAGVAYQTFLNYTKKLVKQGVVVCRKDTLKKGKTKVYRLKGVDEAAKESAEAEKATPSVLTIEKKPQDFNAESAIVQKPMDTEPTIGS
jgi:hypothetical protein